MKLYPSGRFTIEVAQPAAVVHERLRRAVETPRPFRQFSRSHEHPPFEGWIRGDNTFEISRIIHYGNSFLPIVEGRIAESNERTVVYAKIAILWAMVFTVALGLLGFAVAGIAIFYATGDTLLLAGAGGFFLLFTAILYIVGWWEIRAARRLLREVVTSTSDVPPMAVHHRPMDN